MLGERGRTSRPTSLLLEAAPPEREPLRFDVQLVGAPPEVEQLVNNIKQVAEDFLYHWKTFPIVLPQSRFTGHGNKPSDIIIAPPCDELDPAALDAGLEAHLLSPKQLHSIREKGEFEVPSRNFPGQTHVWRVASWLQRGRERVRDELYCHIARAVVLIIIVARDRLIRDKPFSVISGAKSLLQGFHGLLDSVIGMPWLEARDLDKKIRDERSRYLVAELICKPEHQEDIAALAAWVRRAMRRAASEKSDVCYVTPRSLPRVPYVYTTPQRTQVDLRLYKRDILRRAASTLQAILERESRGWFLHFREKRAALLATQKMPMKDIEENVREAAMREYVSRVCTAVVNNETLRALGDGIPELLAAQLRAAAILNGAEDGVRKKLEAGLATAEARICASHPILSRSKTWRNEKLTQAAEKLTSSLRWARMEDAATTMFAHKLHQHRYFLLRDLTFLKDREPLLLKELRAATSPQRTFQWTTVTWCRRRDRRGVSPLQRQSPRQTCTRYSGWRLLNAAHRSWCWSLNLMFFLGIVVPWCSPFSLRTLVCVKPFVPEYELTQVNESISPKRNNETQTMWSRLLALWRHVSKERTRFETEPDTGLLGKGLSRLGNRAWNYGVVGGGGTVALLLLFPLLSLACSLISLVGALCVPLCVPPAALALHAAHALFYDADRPKGNKWFVILRVIVWHIGVLGLLQPLAASLVAVVVCPLFSLILLIGGLSWWSLRGVWEEVWWQGVIRRAARVPAHDSAFCRRLTGPGLHTKTYYQITSAQAIAAVCARAETEALNAWSNEMERAIEQPLRDYAHFVDACFGPFSVQIAKTGAYKQLEKECNELTMTLRDKIAARKQDLALGLGDNVRARVRMTSQDLREAVQACAQELSVVWRGASDEWWAGRGLEPAHWHALAANTLVEVFDAEILVALGESEARLQLEGVDPPPHCAPPDVLAEQGPWRQGASELWSSWGGAGAPRVPPPSLDPTVFSPRAALQPPLCCVACCALLLHNRDSSNPIPLDSELCAEILRSLEDAPDSDDYRDSVERCRGGGESELAGGEGEGSSISSTEGSDDTHDDVHVALEPERSACRISSSNERAACRWTLTGRGVRLRADLASPEDVTLDVDRAHVGTSV